MTGTAGIRAGTHGLSVDCIPPVIWGILETEGLFATAQSRVKAS